MFLTNDTARVNTRKQKAEASAALAPQHLADLRGSGLSDEMIAAMRCRSVPSGVAAEAVDLWTGKGPRMIGVSDVFMRQEWAFGPCLEIPYLDLGGEPTGYARYKPTHPRTDPQRDRRAIKYESPRGQPNRLYIAPGVGPILPDPKTPLAIAEGEKKAACGWQHGIPCVGIAGVWAWKSKGAGLLPDFDGIALGGRRVFLVPDSDYATNPNVRKAMRALGAALMERGAAVEVVWLPSVRDGKTGLDDYIVAGGAAALYKSLRIDRPPNFSIGEEEGEGEARPPIYMEKLGGARFNVKIPCERVHRRLLEHLTHGNDAAVGLWCKQWSCQGCCPRKQEEWSDHCRVLMEGLQARGGAAHVFHGRLAEWNRVRDRLKTAGANYVRVERASFELHHLGGFRFRARRIDALTVVSDRPFKDAERVDPAHAAGILTDAVAAFLPDDSLPCLRQICRQRPSTSRPWKLSERGDPKYKDQAPIYRGQKEVIETAMGLGLEVEVWEDPQSVAEGADISGYPIGYKECLRDEVCGRQSGWRERRKDRKAPADLPDDFRPDAPAVVRLACGLRVCFAVSPEELAAAKREIMRFTAFNERRAYERERMRQYMAERRFFEDMEARKHYRGKKVANS